MNSTLISYILHAVGGGLSTCPLDAFGSIKKTKPLI
jgi:hypothetical protein